MRGHGRRESKPDPWRCGGFVSLTRPVTEVVRTDRGGSVRPNFRAREEGRHGMRRA